MELLGDVGQVEACFGPFGDSVNLGTRLVHGLCRTYHGMKMFLVAPDGTPGDEGQVEARFGLLGEGVNLDAK
jgi:hypothetical protein